MKLLEKIIFTIFWVTIWFPFIFQDSEIRFKGTESQYIYNTPNFSLFYIPIASITIWIIIKIWEIDKKINK